MSKRASLVAVLAVSCFACERRSSPVTIASATPSGPAVSSSPAASAAPSSSASASPPAPSASTPRPGPPALDEVGAVILWIKDDAARGGYRSRWIEPGRSAPAPERPGIVAASSRTTWTLGSDSILGCPQPRRDKDGNVLVQGTIVTARPPLEMPVLVAAIGARVAPWKDGHGYPIFGTSCPDTLQQYEPRVTFEGGLGPFITATVRAYEDHGGAHGVRHADAAVVDLEAARRVTLEPLAQDFPALQTAAGKALSVDPKETRFASVTLLVGPSGGAIALYKLWTAASYAGGSGDGSYSNDTSISSRSLPKELAGFEKLPAWAVGALNGATRPAFVVTKARMAEARAEFDAAYGGK